jgi:hypothetical protein
MRIKQPVDVAFEAELRAKRDPARGEQLEQPRAGEPIERSSL